MMRVYGCLMLICIFAGKVTAQAVGDSILANETALIRPLNLHKGQLRISGDYALTAINKSYDNTGHASSLSDLGLGRSRHEGSIQLKYGLSEYLELKTELRFEKQTIREPTQQIVGYPDLERYSLVTSVTEAGGIEDLLAGLSFRIPLSTSKFDLVPFVGALIPVTSDQAKQPTHKLTESASMWNVDYKYDQPVSKGVFGLQVGGAMKYRSRNWGITLHGYYEYYSDESTQVQWNAQLNADKEFEYRSTDYTVGRPQTVYLSGVIEFQTSPFFQLFLESELTKTSASWYEWEGTKYRIEDSQLLSCGPGFDLIITPRVWLREQILIPVMGQSIEAGIHIQTSLAYNLFVR